MRHREKREKGYRDDGSCLPGATEGIENEMREIYLRPRARPRRSLITRSKKTSRIVVGANVAVSVRARRDFYRAIAPAAGERAREDR